MAITVLISLQFFTKLLYFTPTAILASIILSAIPGLIDISEAYKIWKVDKLDFLACIGAFLGVLFGSVEIGLLVAVKSTFSYREMCMNPFIYIYNCLFTQYIEGFSQEKAIFLEFCWESQWGGPA